MEANALTQYRPNRIITIEHPVTSRDLFGDEITTWTPLVEVWADKRPSTGKERFVTGSSVTQAVRAATWRIQFGTGVNELMRVVDEQRRVWNIIGLAEVGRRQYHDLICQSVGELLPPPAPTAEAKAAPPDEEPHLKPELPKPPR